MFADIGFGIFIAIIFSKAFNYPISGWFILFSIGLVLLPDIDFLLKWILKKKMPGHEHRDTPHYPFVYILLSPIIFMIYGIFWTDIFLTSVFVHLIHDSFGIGWGIEWLWPFSNKTYKFFSNDINEFGLNMYARNPDELKEAQLKYGKSNWMQYYYFRPTAISVTESLVFILSLIVLYSYTH